MAKKATRMKSKRTTARAKASKKTSARGRKTALRKPGPGGGQIWGP